MRRLMLVFAGAATLLTASAGTNASFAADMAPVYKAAPPVLEFDEAGNFIQAWGGPGQGYDWPETEHGIYADPKGFIWLGGNGRTDHHLVKFTRDGKFVMQIGRKGESKGNKDTQNVRQAADTCEACIGDM